MSIINGWWKILTVNVFNVYSLACDKTIKLYLVVEPLKIKKLRNFWYYKN